MAKYLSGRSKKTPQSALSDDRYRYLDVSQAEPNIGDPAVPGPVIPVGQQYQLVSVLNFPGERYWIPVGGGLIPGSISIFDEGFITPPGGVSSITQLNFVGSAISAQGYLTSTGHPGIGVTIRVFSPGSQGQFIFNNNNDFSAASNIVYDNSTNYVGIGTTIPTQELDVTGDLRLRGTIYDFNNQPGANAQVLVKNNFGGLTWVNQDTLRAGAGGTITNIQYHNNVGLVDGAPNFVFDYINSRVGIGSTLPGYLLDVRGYSRFRGQTEIDYLDVTGVATISQLGVTGLTTTKNLTVTDTSTFTGTIDANGGATIDNIQIGITSDNTIDTTTGNLTIGSFGGTTNITGITSVGFITARTGFIGILTVTEVNIERTNLINLNVTGIATIATLGVTGLTTTRNLNVIGVTTTKNLKVTDIATFDNQINTNNLNLTGIGTFGSVKISGNMVGTTSGNLTLDSSAGITQINDAVYVNDTTQSDDKDTGSIVTEGGVGIEKNLNVGGQLNVAGITTLASSGGITTTGGDLYVGGQLKVAGIVTTSTDLYVGGDLYVNDDIFFDEFNSRRGTFTESLTTKDFRVTGVATIATLGVTGLTTTKDLIVTGITTLRNTLYITNTTDAAGDIIANGGTDGIFGIFNSTNSGSITFNPKNSGGTYNNIFELNSSTAKVNGNFIVTGISTLATLGVTGLTTTKNLIVIGISTFTDFIDANGGAYIDNVQIGITNDNTIDTTTGNLVIDSAGGTTNVNDNLIVSGIATFNNNVVFGDATTDTVSFTSRVSTNLLPSTNGTLDLGNTSQKWNNVYANTFIGAIIGNADTATKLANARNIAITGDLAWNVNFDGSTNVTAVGTLANSGVVAATYGSSTTVPVFAVDAKGRVTSSSNITIGFSTATVANSDKIATIATATNATFYPTFVDSNNSIVAYESVYTDSGITYNPSTDILSLTNLIVSGTSTFNGNVTLGDTTSDTVSFISRVSSSIIPSTNGTLDLGGPSNKWNNVYANTFIGAITGNADTATALQNSRNFSISGDTTAPVVSFNGTGNVNLVTTLANTGVIAATYGSSTTVPVFTVDAKGRLTSVTNTGIAFSAATVAQADKLTNARNIEITGDLAWNVNFDGSQNVTAVGTLANTSVIAATYGSSTTVPVFAVDAKGRITSVTNTGINFGTATVANSDKIATIATATNATFYPTFVDSNNISAAYESVYTDPGITYNPSTDLLTVTNLTANGNVIFGDSTSDTVSFTSRISSSILPSTNGTLDLGGSSNKWNNVYANNFVGAITGNADTATRLTTSRNIAITGDLSWNVNFDGSTNVTAVGSLTNTGVVAGTYGSSSTVPVFAVDAKGRVTSVTNTSINFSNANVAKADAATILSPRSSSPYTTIDTQGSYIHWNRQNGDGATWLINQRGGGAGGFIFADSTSSASNVNGGTTGLNTTLRLDSSGNITGYGLLTIPNIKPTGIQDASGGTGTNNFVLTANGSGGWTWKSITGGGSPAIGGITIQEEGTQVGTALGTQILNFIGGSVTATSPTAGTANINITAASDILVNQTGYGCANPVTVTGGNTINISSASNAYGTRYVQTTAPSSPCNGDVWYNPSGSSDSGFEAGTILLFYQANAPTGWTKVTTQDNKALRVVSGTGGGSGGTSNFTSVFTNRGVPLAQHSHSVNDPTHGHSVNDPGHAHGVFDPGHSHTLNGKNDAGGDGGGVEWNQTFDFGRGGGVNGAGTGIGIFGAGTGVVVNGNGTGISIQNAGTAGASMDFAVQYIDIIIASKN